MAFTNEVLPAPEGAEIKYKLPWGMDIILKNKLTLTAGCSLLGDGL
jgi:hypothetical protein